MNCIFCDLPGSTTSVEHIVPEALGNKMYVMKKGDICDICNSFFSTFESVAVNASIIGMERSYLGGVTKQGKPGKGLIRANNTEIQVEGREDFAKNYLYIKPKENIELKDFDPTTKKFTMKVENPNEKEAVAISKILIKIGIESLYTSCREVYDYYDFSKAKLFARGKENKPWPFVMLLKDNSTSFDNILQDEIGISKHLAEYKIKLYYMEANNKDVLFRFSFGAFKGLINLVDSELDWIGLYLKHKLIINSIFPPSLGSKLEKKFPTYFTNRKL